MNLLEKFNSVVIQADNRISEADKFFCEKNQEAYEEAINSYKELAFFWEDMLAAQEAILGPKSGSLYTNYLSSSDGAKISTKSIHTHIKSLHSIFIARLVSHFDSVYNITVSISDITESMLPKEPDSYYRSHEEEWEAHNQVMLNLTRCAISNET